MHKAVVVSAILILAAPAVRAEDPADVPAGMLVRVSQGHWKVKGLVMAADPQTLTLAVSGQDMPVRLARSRITRLEVGERRSGGAGALRGAGPGLVFGTALGGVLGYASSGEDRGENAAMSALAAGSVWAVIGGVIGAARPGERWKTVPIERVQVGLTPRRGGVGLAMSLAF